MQKKNNKKTTTKKKKKTLKCKKDVVIVKISETFVIFIYRALTNFRRKLLINFLNTGVTVYSHKALGPVVQS